MPPEAFRWPDCQLKAVTLEGGTTADLNLQLNLANGKAQITVTGVVGEIRTNPQPPYSVITSDVNN